MAIAFFADLQNFEFHLGLGFRYPNRSLMGTVSIMKLGTEAPRVIDRRVARIPVNVTILTLSLLNQFRATLLGVLRMNMLPIAASIEPIKQYTDCPTSKNSLSQTPEIMKIVPITKDSLMPYLLMNQLQGKAKMGCAIVKSRAFIVTKMLEILKVS